MTETVKVLITGDFYGGGRINDLILKGDYKAIFNDFLPIIKESDIAITNLEAPLTKEIKAIQKTGPAIKSPLETAKALKSAGFNLLTLANNHIMDFGEQGLIDTFKELEKEEIGCLGVGKNLKDAQKPLYKEVKGYKLAFLNFAENEWATTQGNNPGANPLNPVTNYYAIRQAKTEADFVFVVAHGGHEMYSLPSPRMKNVYRFFIDAGANAVIGHHTHVISGYEVYKGSPIFYSLGNFVFDSLKNKEPRWKKGIAIQFSISGEKLAFEVIPYSQNAEKPGVDLLSGAEKAAVETEIRRLSETILDDTKLEEEFEKYCQKVARLYDYYLEPHSNKYLSFVQRKKFLPSLLSKKKRLLFKNLIRCEAHRDVVLKIIQK